MVLIGCWSNLHMSTCGETMAWSKGKHLNLRSSNWQKIVQANDEPINLLQTVTEILHIFWPNLHQLTRFFPKENIQPFDFFDQLVKTAACECIGFSLRRWPWRRSFWLFLCRRTVMCQKKSCAIGQPPYHSYIQPWLLCLGSVFLPLVYKGSDPHILTINLSNASLQQGISYLNVLSSSTRWSAIAQLWLAVL